MDPSANLCLLHDSFSENLPPSPIPNWYNNISSISLTPQFNQISIDSHPPATFVNSQKYNILQRVKDSFDTEGFIDARNNTNPFEQIGRSIFINRAAVKLANIDAVHHITNHVFTFNNKQTDKPFTFCDVAAGPGGFTQYLQYRFPNSKGYGMTLRHEQLDWSTRFLDMSRFFPHYGPDNTGNLYHHWKYFIDTVLKEQPNGVDLVTADGGFDLEDGMDKTLLHRQEFLSSRLLVTQALVGLGCNKVGGNFVLKVFDTVTNLSAQVIYLLSKCYSKVTIFKPVTSRPANAERYLLCMDRNANITDMFNLLSSAANTYTDDSYLNNIFAENLPNDFIKWLTEINDDSVNLQINSAQHILKYLQNDGTIDNNIPRYDIHKFLIIWNLPDTPPRPPRRQRN